MQHKQIERYIAKAKKQKESGQKALYLHFAQAMLRICYRYLGDHFEAEETLTDGFLKAFEKIKQFDNRGEGAFKAWLSKIMINQCLQKLRKRKLFFEEVEDNHFEGNEKNNPYGALESEAIYQAIASLPTGYRTVFNLFVIEGYSHLDIALQLNITENTSKSQLRKAKMALQLELKAYYHE